MGLQINKDHTIQRILDEGEIIAILPELGPAPDYKDITKRVQAINDDRDLECDWHMGEDALDGVIVIKQIVTGNIAKKIARTELRRKFHDTKVEDYEASKG